jgi:hypothetical protein
MSRHHSITALLGMTVGIVVIATSVLGIASGEGPFLGAVAICMGALAFCASVMGYISALSKRVEAAAQVVGSGHGTPVAMFEGSLNARSAHSVVVHSGGHHTPH